LPTPSPHHHMHRVLSWVLVGLVLVMSGCSDREPLTPAPDDPEYFYGFDFGENGEFVIHFEPLWGATEHLWGAGIDFRNVNFALADEWSPFGRYYAPTSGSSFLHVSEYGYPHKPGELLFDFAVRDIRFNTRLYADMTIRCFNGDGSLVAQASYPGTVVSGGVWSSSYPVPYTLRQVELRGRGIRKCVINSDGAMIDDLRYRRDRNELTVSCTGDLGQNRVTRGAELNCEARGASEDDEIEIERWSFTGTDSQDQPYTFPGDLDGPITDNPWRGKMAISGVVSVWASVNGGEVEGDSVRVTVEARSWKNENISASVRKVNWAEFPVLKRPSPYPTDVRDLGRTSMDWEALSFDASVIEQISDFGPNHYLLYLKRVPAQLAVMVLVHPEMETRGDFWRRQPSRRPEFSEIPPCIQGEFEQYVRLILAHEGVPPNPESHAGIYISEFSHRAGPRVEGLVYLDSDRQKMLDAAVLALNAVALEAHGLANDPVDVHYAIPFGCEFYYGQR
jgi:hypothetical protein